MKVDVVTLGDAASRINVPPPTLRNWTDQLEKIGVHYTIRNNRNERVYNKDDLDIFNYVRELRKEYGRRTTTKDIAGVLVQDSRFNLRAREDAPKPSDDSSNTAELLNHEDIKTLMESERVKQFVSIIASQTSKQLKDELVGELSDEIEEKMRIQIEENKKFQEELTSVINDNNKLILSRVETYKEKEKKGFFARLFG